MDKCTWHVVQDTVLENFLDSIPGISGRKRRDIFKCKRILVNGSYRTRSTKLHSGDVIAITLPPESWDEAPIDLGLEILYEDDYILAVNKPPYVTMTRGKTTGDRTLSAGVSYLLATRGLQRKVRFVNRLDRDTSGVVLVAKFDLAHSAFASYWDQTDKKYWAIASGDLFGDFVARDYLTYDEKQLRYLVAPTGTRAITSFRVVEPMKGATLLEATLQTGKTHQIRASLAGREHPLLGDTLYGGPQEAPRQMLHAKSLSLNHPYTNERVDIEAPVPEDFLAVWHNKKIR